MFYVKDNTLEKTKTNANPVATYLGEPAEWLSILERNGVLQYINQELTLWKHKPLLTNPRIRITEFTSASSFLDLASREKKIRWFDFLELLPWRMKDNINQELTPISFPPAITVQPSTVYNDAMDTSEVKVPATMDWRQYLRQRLSSEYYDASDTDQDKDNHIESVLTNPIINNYLRQEVGWLLPNDATLWDLLQNCDGRWAHLVAPLVEVAERGLDEVDTTFPVLNPRKAIEEALKMVDELPFMEVVIYDPKMSKEDRLAAWCQAAPTVIQQPQLCKWLKKPESMARKLLSQKQMDGMFDKLMDQVEQNNQLRSEVLAVVKQKNPKWIMADFANLLNELFDQSVSAEEAPALNFTTNQTWTAKKFLADLKINNPKLEEQLKEMEDDVSMFELTPKSDWPQQLWAWGATGAQHFKITAALAKAGLIK